MRLLALVPFLAACASAQVVAPGPRPILIEDTSAAPPADDRTEVEAAVAATVTEPGVHVVHFWAPWCGNSTAELEGGLYEVVEAHPDVSFSFVTIWTDGRDGADRLARYGIEPSERVAIYGQPDRGPSADRDLRRRTFLGLPLSWTPTTWVFNREGKLAYAFNYGEVSNDMLTAAIADARNEWTHE
ncbi:TlpA family protein disulfide reductase [Rubrivirga sp.]|uniref:TlpA family protein disulfide reductase n=1 Tax=Rubrivirga sp. TaxID=1885344 RepID=UPI003B51D680